MGNTCKSMADSFQCMTKPTTIKKNKIKVKIKFDRYKTKKKKKGRRKRKRGERGLVKGVKEKKSSIPLGSDVPSGFTLESNVHIKSFRLLLLLFSCSRVQLFVNPWTAARLQYRTFNTEALETKET